MQKKKMILTCQDTREIIRSLVDVDVCVFLAAFEENSLILHENEKKNRKLRGGGTLAPQVHLTSRLTINSSGVPEDPSLGGPDRGYQSRSPWGCQRPTMGCWAASINRGKFTNAKISKNQRLQQ